MVANSTTWRGVQVGIDARGLAAEASLEVDRFVREIWPQAYRVAFSVLRDHGLAEDAAQEACARVLHELPKLRAPRAFNVWLYRIVVRAALSIGKRHRRVESVELDAFESGELADTVLRIDVMRALDRLSEHQRVIVALYFYAEMNSREIAKVLSIPDSTVRFHVMNAKRLLVSLLKEKG